MKVPLFGIKRLEVIGALIPFLEATPAWERRWEIEVYVWKCIDAGFCQTEDQMRLCAERWVAGKRKVTPPGTQRRKNEARKKAKLLADVPTELMAAVTQVLEQNVKAVEQYRGGLEKALNALVGGVMKRYKSDPSTVKDLLIRTIGT